MSQGGFFTTNPTKHLNRDIIFYWIKGPASGMISKLGFGPKNPVEATQRQRDRAGRQAERETRRLEMQ